MEMLEKQIGKVLSFGVYDDVNAFFQAVLKIITSDIIVSSNLKSNVLFLLLYFKKGVVILNGLGRYRKKKYFRLILLLLLRINLYKKDVVVQNYADWRYFKMKLGASDNLLWCPGSGGKKRYVGKNKGYFIVLRKDKLSCVIKSVCEFLDKMSNPDLFVVGCNSEDIIVYQEFRDRFVYPVGYQKQCDILSYGNSFVQLSGYGEGFPHTLADAIVTGLNIYIPSELYVQLGLYKMNANVDYVVPGWLKITPSNELIHVLDANTVNDYYYKVIKKKIESA